MSLLGLLAWQVSFQLADSPAYAQQEAPPKKETVAEERNFYQVLEDLLGDFEFDLKNGQVAGIRDLAVRNLATSENVPPSFKNHLELALTERILKNGKSRVIQCLPCRAKKTSVTGDKVVITSPDSNPIEQARIAKLSGIAHFMDVAFTFQPQGMMLSLTTTEPETGSVVWSRSYNSETSRAAAFRRGVDHSQIDEARKQSEYQPSIQYRVIAYYLFQPDVGTTTGCLGAGLRMMERYDNRKKEVGFELDYFRNASSIAGGSSTSSTSTNIWGGLNLTLLFIHSWNFIGYEENYNRVRGSLYIGIGGTYASGFLGALIRAGYEWRLAKSWTVTPVLGYRPKATAFLNGASAGKVSGVEWGLGISYLF